MARKALRLLMTTETMGSVWSYTMELLRSLAPHQCEVMLITMGAPLSARQRQEALEIPQLSLCESLYKVEWMEEPWAHVDASGAWLMELAHDFRPDVVHLNSFAHGELPWSAPLLIVAHTCAECRWRAVTGWSAPSKADVYHQRVHAGLSKADLVIAPTQAMLTELEACHGPLRATQVIHHARQASDFESQPKEPFIFTMGRIWDESKNIGMLEQIASKVPWPIYAAGEQWHPSGKHVELKNVRTLGPLEPQEMRAWLSRAAIYVHPAHYEPFGLAVVEAALSGCTLMLSDIHSLRELWDGAALFVPPDNAIMFANGLRYLTGSPYKRALLAETSTRRAQQYSPDAMGRSYWNVYNMLIVGQNIKSAGQSPTSAFLASRAYPNRPNPAPII